MWRLLILTETNPYKNMAIEEALFNSVECDASPDTIRLWKCTPSAVLGWSQRAETELNIDNCRHFKVSIVRRFTGGGAIYYDLGNVNWTFVCRKSSWPQKMNNLSQVFESFSVPLVDALAWLGVEADFKAPNAICVNGSKISGMAMYIKRQAILCHGTLLVDSDLGLMRKVLKKMKDSVTNVKSEARTSLTVRDVEEAIERTAMTVLDVRTVDRELRSQEQESLMDYPLSKYIPLTPEQK